MQLSFITRWKELKTRLFSHGGELRRNPKASWTVILSLFALGILAALIIGYVTYYRAVGDEGLNASSPVVRSPLRTTDVRAVIETYQAKKERMNALLSDEPTYLSPQKSVTPIQKEQSVTETVSTSTPPKTTP